jgi:hypothetical protein
MIVVSLEVNTGPFAPKQLLRPGPPGLPVHPDKHTYTEFYLFICTLFNYIISNSYMILNERTTVNNKIVEGNITSFAWRDWEKP